MRFQGLKSLKSRIEFKKIVKDAQIQGWQLSLVVVKLHEIRSLGGNYG
jgi:hypothetical protein